MPLGYQKRENQDVIKSNATTNALCAREVKRLRYIKELIQSYLYPEPPTVYIQTYTSVHPARNLFDMYTNPNPRHAAVVAVVVAAPPSPARMKTPLYQP